MPDDDARLTDFLGGHDGDGTGEPREDDPAAAEADGTPAERDAGDRAGGPAADDERGDGTGERGDDGTDGRDEKRPDETDERGDGETDEGDDRGTDERNGNDDERPPALSTAEWTGGGAPCDDCGTTVRRRWRDGERLVCPDCKSW